LGCFGVIFGEGDGNGRVIEDVARSDIRVQILDEGRTIRRAGAGNLDGLAISPLNSAITVTAASWVKT